MTDQERKAMEMAIDALENNLPLIEDYGSKEQLNIHHKAIAALYKTLAQPEPWDTSDMAYRPNGLSVEQEPVAWVRDLTSPQPHCVTSLKYRSVADTDAGVKYIPVYTAPPSKPWVSLTDEGIRLMCHNDEPEDWNDLKERQSWREAYIQGAKAAQDELRSKNNE